LTDGMKKEVKLVNVTDSEIGLLEEKGKGKPGGKKKEIVEHTIPFDQIKTTKIQIKF
jgi:ribosome maturation factor RimP